MSLQNSLRGMLRRHRSAAVILLYHRVAELESDPQLLSVTPRHFAEHLDVLRRRYRPTPLMELASGPAWGRRADVVITFDDGYADNLHGARAPLEAADCPATVFVAAGNTGGDREFWWDNLERILLRTSVLPERLQLSVAGTRFMWDLGDSTQVTDPRWNVLDAAPLTPRETIYIELASRLKGLDVVERDQIMEELQQWAGMGPAGRVSHRAMAGEELHSLAADGLVEIGAHTVNHPSLAAMSEPIQQREIFDSKSRLEQILDRPVRSFSYPFGSRDDYNDGTVRLAREAGFDVACVNHPGIVRRATDRHRLPRMLVRDWDGDEFSRRLEAAFAG